MALMKTAFVLAISIVALIVLFVMGIVVLDTWTSYKMYAYFPEPQREHAAYIHRRGTFHECGDGGSGIDYSGLNACFAQSRYAGENISYETNPDFDQIASYYICESKGYSIRFALVQNRSDYQFWCFSNAARLPSNAPEFAPAAYVVLPEVPTYTTRMLTSLIGPTLSNSRIVVPNNSGSE